MAMQGFDLFCSKREGLLDNGFSLLLHTNAFVTLKLLVYYLEALEAGKESSSFPFGTLYTSFIGKENEGTKKKRKKHED